jgi:pyruvate/2-oxoglutarate dehydrogenase complex dihydrolipoamide acyltransferase (E2) component
MDGTFSSRLWRPLVAALSLSAMVLVPAAAARADDTPASVLYGAGTAGEATALQIARDAWGGDACGGPVALGWGALDPMVNARADWKNPTDAFANPVANVHCTITFNSTIDFTWDEYCTVMVHEYGHLLGQRHSDDEHSVMYPTYVEAFPACAATPDPAARAAPAAADDDSASTVARAPATTKSKAKPKARAKPRRSRHSKRSAHRRARAHVRARQRARARELRLRRAHTRDTSHTRRTA